MALADRIRHAAHVSQDCPSVRINPRVVGGVLVPDRLTVERRRRRFHSTSRQRARVAWLVWRYRPWRAWLGLWWLNVWWTREGLRGR